MAAEDSDEARVLLVIAFVFLTLYLVLIKNARLAQKFIPQAYSEARQVFFPIHTWNLPKKQAG